MGVEARIAGALAISALMAIAAAGCGGSSNASSSSTAKSGETETNKATETKPAKPFPGSIGKKKIPTFGEEANAAEREAASAVLEENLKARETGDWATQCATLSPVGVKEVEQGASAQGLSGGGCTKELKARAEPLKLTKSLRVDTMTGPIDALRIEGEHGYAIYHGTRGQEFAMPMEKVNGEWKVDALLEEAI